MNSARIDQNYLLKTLREMISINSALPEEQALAAYLAEQIRHMGVEPDWHEVAPGRPNVCALAEFGVGGRFLVYSGHSDTVPAASGCGRDPAESWGSPPAPGCAGPFSWWPGRDGGGSRT